MLEEIIVSSLAVEESYEGPHLQNDRVTLDFIEELLDFYRNNRGTLHYKYVLCIIKQANQILRALPSLVDIYLPPNKKLTVCGDIHGQFYDLLTIFDTNGMPSCNNSYLFNGDFVDRGRYSVECALTLLSLKVLYPSEVHISRGNHETIEMNSVHGFEDEVRTKYKSDTLTGVFNETFNWLPLAYCINRKVFIVHGGLNDDPQRMTLEYIRDIKRNRQPGTSGLMCDLLWSDPMKRNGVGRSKRGVGICFGPDVTSRFVQRNQLDYVIRSHEVKSEGYDVTHNGLLVTVFSAPNYCDEMGNNGAYITIKGNDLKPKFHVFQASPQPCH